MMGYSSNFMNSVLENENELENYICFLYGREENFVRVVKIIVLIVIMVVFLIGNFLIIIIIGWIVWMRKVVFNFIVNMVIVDFCIMIINMFEFFFVEIEDLDEWIFGDIGVIFCKFLLFC